MPLYYGSAIIFRALQADLDSLENIAIVGIIHGAAEVIERSTMVFIDHIFYLLWKRKSAPWGSFRTPRRERLTADIAIMSMMSESTAIVSVNGFIYLFKFLCLQDSSLLMVLLLFAKFTLVQLVIRMVFHQCFTGDRDSLSEFGCHGCMGKTMEKTHFSGGCKYYSFSSSYQRRPFATCKWTTW